MAHSKSSATRVAAAERRARALELRKGGKSFAAIGRELGVSEPRAHAIVTGEPRRLNERRAEQAAEVTRLELERLDSLSAALWARALEGEVAAVDRVLAIMTRRAKLLALDGPGKRALRGAGGQPLLPPWEELVRLPREALLALYDQRLKASGGAA